MAININTLNGRFMAIPVDGGLGETSTGKEQVAALFKLTGEGETKGIQLTWYGYFTDGTVDSTIEALRAMGWKGNDLSELLDWKKAIPTPEECELTIEPELQVDFKSGQPLMEEDGKTQKVRARIRWVNPARKVMMKTALPADKAAAFAARMKGKLVAFDQQNGAPKNNGAPTASPPRQPAAPAKDPGDIPF